jgi:hypothetical protein
MKFYAKEKGFMDEQKYDMKFSAIRKGWEKNYSNFFASCHTAIFI